MIDVGVGVVVGGALNVEVSRLKDSHVGTQ